MRTTDADQLLMRRFQEGDDAAFELLVHEYQGLVLSLCRRYLGSRSPGVEDVAQEVFLRIYRGRMTYEPRAKVKTWIYSIAVNACLNEIRRLRSKKNRAVNTFTAVFGDADTTSDPVFADRGARQPDGDLDGDETARRVREAVDQLPEQQRLALVLSRFQHCSYEEVAGVMETTVPAVKSLLTRARENLRKKLCDLVDETPDMARRGKGSAPAWGTEDR